MHPVYVYILRCADGSLYTGHTNDLERRFAEHQSGVVRGWTWRRRPVTFVRAWEFPDRLGAFLFERQIKGWTRAKKLALCDEDWSALKELARKANARRVVEPGPDGSTAPGKSARLAHHDV